MKPAIVFRHPDGMGEIIADPENGCLWVSRPAHSETEVSVTIGPRGLHSVAIELLKMADAIDDGGCVQ